MPGLGFLLSAFGMAKKAFQSVMGAAFRYPWQTGLIVALIAVAWLWRANSGLHERLDTERAAHAMTIRNYKVAQAEAEAVQSHNLVRVAQAYTDINERAINDLQASHADTDARYRRLLAKADQYRSAPRDPDVSANAEAACRAYAASDCASIPAKLKAAQDNTDQLLALQSWASSIAAINTSPGGP